MSYFRFLILRPFSDLDLDLHLDKDLDLHVGFRFFFVVFSPMYHIPSIRISVDFRGDPDLIPPVTTTIFSLVTSSVTIPAAGEYLAVMSSGPSDHSWFFRSSPFSTEKNAAC